jgi:hypothetical protein
MLSQGGAKPLGEVCIPPGDKAFDPNSRVDDSVTSKQIQCQSVPPRLVLPRMIHPHPAMILIEDHCHPIQYESILSLTGHSGDQMSHHDNVGGWIGRCAGPRKSSALLQAIFSRGRLPEIHHNHISPPRRNITTDIKVWKTGSGRRGSGVLQISVQKPPCSRPPCQGSFPWYSIP